MKIRPVGVESFHEERTDGHEEAKNLISLFSERA
jgi:hypothetical protein